MKLRKPLIITAITLTGLVASGASPASAGPGDTIATFELLAGSLGVAVAPTAVWADATSDGQVDQYITGNLGPVTVTDDRGGIAPWEVSAISTTFTHATGPSSTLVEYMAGTVTTDGTIDVDATVETTLDPIAEASVVSVDSLSGNNTASWNPTLTVTLPEGALAGEYSGTVTTSIL